MEPYNAVLYTHTTLEHCDCAFLVDNQVDWISTGEQSLTLDAGDLRPVPEQPGDQPPHLHQPQQADRPDHLVHHGVPEVASFIYIAVVDHNIT